MSYDPCTYCHNMAVKTNSNAEPICYNRAFYGSCEEPKAAEPIRKKKSPGRNDQCPCGSGKKYKHCHLK